MVFNDCQLSSFYPVGGDDDSDSESATTQINKRFTQSKKPLTLEMVKGTLLGTSDQILSALAEIILESSEYDGGEF